jgi:hypothetical protein
MKRFCLIAIELLADTRQFGLDFVNLRMEFHRLHGHNLILSTWHGADFFQNVLFCLDNNQLGFDGKDGEPSGEYKDNFKKLIQFGLKETEKTT